MLLMRLLMQMLILLMLQTMQMPMSLLSRVLVILLMLVQMMLMLIVALTFSFQTRAKCAPPHHLRRGLNLSCCEIDSSDVDADCAWARLPRWVIRFLLLFVIPLPFSSLSSLPPFSPLPPNKMWTKCGQNMDIKWTRNSQRQNQTRVVSSVLQALIPGHKGC